MSTIDLCYFSLKNDMNIEFFVLCTLHLFQVVVVN